MKKTCLTAIIAIMAIASISLSAQQKTQPKDPKENSLQSDALDNEGKSRDLEIKDLCEKIQGVVQKNSMMDTTKGFNLLPYQTTFVQAADSITIEKHVFIRNEVTSRIVGERRKSVKLYISGGNLTKIDSEIFENDRETGVEQVVSISDPTPLTEATDDIVIKQYVNKNSKSKLTLETTFGKVKNTTAFPVRNDLKRDFYIPHLLFFYNTVLSIAETYSKQMKDDDSSVLEFLKKASR